MQPRDGAEALTRAETQERFDSLRLLPGNDRCAECHAADTTWVVLDHGVLVCVLCAGAHRGLGTHISKVRSTQHDQFSVSECEWLEALGNAKSAALYEGALPPTVRRPLPSDSGGYCPDVVRRTWLRLKYDEQRFTAGTEHFTEALSHEQCEGWLQKQGSLLPTWRRRFFRVHGHGRLLSYSSDASGAEGSLRGCLALAGCTVEVDEHEPLHMKLRTLLAQEEGGGAAAAAGAGGAAGGETAAGRGGGATQVEGRGGSGGGKTSTMLLRASSAADAERWAWTLYQCSHAAAVRTFEETPEEAAAMAAALPKPGRVRQRRSLFPQRRTASIAETA